MLEYKGIPFKRVDLLPVVGRGVLKAMRFPGVTIPSLRLDGRKITGSREISKALNEAVPEPPLFPVDPEEKAEVEEAERWGEEELSDAIRRILWTTVKRKGRRFASYLEGARIGVPHGLAVSTAAPVIAAENRIHGINDDVVRADLAALPGMLQQIDDWISEGVFGGSRPNAADFQIAAALRTGDDASGPAPGDRRAARRASWRSGSTRTTRATSRPVPAVRVARAAAGRSRRRAPRAASRPARRCLRRRARRARRSDSSRRAAPDRGRARAAAPARTAAR